MSQLNVDTIKKADGTGNLSVPAETGTVVTTASPSLGRRNIILNGSQIIDQRNSGSSITPTDGQFITDRFNADAAQASKFSAQQVTDAPTGFSHSLKITSSSAHTPASGDYFDVQHKIEGYSTSQLNFGTADAETITLSFYVKSSLTGTFGGTLANSAYNRGYPFTYTISSADTWERKTITLTGDTTGTWVGATNGIGLRIHWSLGIGTTYAGTAGAWAAGLLLGATGQTNVVATNGATWQITGVQLEVGSVATPFEHRSFGEELTLCQRYYYVLQDSANKYVSSGEYVNTNELGTTVIYPVMMRSSPTLKQTTGTDYYYGYSGGYDWFNNWQGIDNNSRRSGYVYANTSQVSGTTGKAVKLGTGSGGFIAFESEL